MKTKIIPITDLRNTNKVLSLVKEDNIIHITKNGYSEMVLMSQDHYEDLSSSNIQTKKQSLHLSKKILEQEHCFGFIKVGTYSLPIKVGNIDENIITIKKNIDDAITSSLSILVLPELSICGYTCNDLLTHPTLYNQIEKGIKEIKNYSKGKDLLIFLGGPFKVENNLYNCAIVIQNNRILGIVPKKELPNYNEFYEERYFSKYQEENKFVIFDKKEIPFGNKLVFVNDSYTKEVIGVEICEDAWVKHSPSLDQVENGASIIVNLSSSNETITKENVRRTLVSEASRKYKCAYLYCSSSYEESTTDLLFSGHNIIAENGNIINESNLFFPNQLNSIIDLSYLSRERINVKNNYSNDFIYIHYQAERKLPISLKERNLSIYPFIYQDYSLKAVDFNKVLFMQALGLARRMTAINSKKVVLGLSGGLDSTLALLVADKAFEIMNLDKKNIICITLPCFGTSKRTYNNALKLSEGIGNTLIEINISKAVEQHLKDINHLDHNYDITYENAQARERTKVLMDYANKVNGLVLGTGDLSEIALGWSTYNGDHMSMYSLNSSIPKTLIKGMFTYFIQNNIYPSISNILDDILDTPISPELIPGQNEQITQKTESIIGPYQLNDFFLYHFINNHYSFPKIYYLAKNVFNDIYKKEDIKKWLKNFIKRFFSSQFKRSCMPDGIKVTSVSLSPRGDLKLPSDISYQSFIDEIDNLD